MITPPKDPGTLKANGFIIDNYLREFFNSYYHGFGYHVTSAYRDFQENIEAGGASDSAHLYNLARDFVILDRSSQIVPEERAKSMWEQFSDLWKGYTYFSPSKPSTGRDDAKGYHIHANLPREWTVRTKWVGGLMTAGIIGFLAYKVFKNPKVQRFFKTKTKE